MPNAMEDCATFIVPDLFGTQEHEKQINYYIDAGVLPQDTYLRVRKIGVREVDWEQPGQRLAFSIAKDIAENAATPAAMRPDTHRLLFGELPDAVLDFEQSANKNAYAALQSMYYRMANLAGAIKRQRAINGQTITETPSHIYMQPSAYEVRRCFGLARPLWRVLVQRYHPEWLARPYDFCAPAISLYGDLRELSQRTMLRRIVGASVISDEVILSAYDEAARTGIQNIGPKGREALRGLLADEHPALF